MKKKIYLSPCSKEVKSRAHRDLVWPQLEYAAEAWNPINITNADRLEHIKHAAARFIHHDYRRTTSVDNLNGTLGLVHPHTRCVVYQLTVFHKIHHHLVNIHTPQTISKVTFIGKHDHDMKYAISVATIDS